MADVIKQVYADRMIDAAGSAGGGRSPRQSMMPGAAMWMMAQQGRGGPPQQGQRRQEEVARMSVGVDQRTNSLIVAAPDPLFQEVKLLVEQLDVAAGDEAESVRVVSTAPAPTPCNGPSPPSWAKRCK